MHFNNKDDDNDDDAAQQVLVDGSDLNKKILSLAQLSVLCWGSNGGEMEESELFSVGVLYWLNKGVLKEVTSQITKTESSLERYFTVDENQQRLAALERSF